MRSIRCRKDEILAFRHAAGWEVKNRWQAFQETPWPVVLRAASMVTSMLAMEKSAMYDLHCDLAKYGDFP